MSDPAERPCERIRADLNAIKEALLSPDCVRGGGDLQSRLESAIAQFRSLHRTISEAGSVESRRVRQDVEELQKQLASLQPLFENAYRLQAGWYEIALADEQGGSYGGDGVECHAARPVYRVSG